MNSGAAVSPVNALSGGFSPHSLFQAFLPSLEVAPENATNPKARVVELPSFGSLSLLGWEGRNFPILIVPEPSEGRAIGKQSAQAADFDAIAKALGPQYRPSRLEVDRSKDRCTALIEKTLQSGANSIATTACMQRSGQEPLRLATLGIQASIAGCAISYSCYRLSDKMVYSCSISSRGHNLAHTEDGFRPKSSENGGAYFIPNREGGLPHDILTGLFKLSSDPKNLNVDPSCLGKFLDGLLFPIGLQLKILS